jgi:hypothetical protein
MYTRKWRAANWATRDARRKRRVANFRQIARPRAASSAAPNPCCAEEHPRRAKNHTSDVFTSRVINTAWKYKHIPIKNNNREDCILVETSAFTQEPENYKFDAKLKGGERSRTLSGKFYFCWEKSSGLHTDWVLIC